jgi:predicted RNase H-like HicB family nuclease
VGGPLYLTIIYEAGDDGWIVSSIPAVPSVLSQGRTKEEAREMALNALAGMLKLRAAEHEPQGRASAASHSTSSRREAT